MMRWAFIPWIAILWAALAPDRALAQCVCGNGDGVFTSHTGITIDGAFADWAVVLLDEDNNACDGAGGVVAPQPDRDAPVQSTGRDLLHFAYSWDATHVHTYTGRLASSKNVQRFIYYADTDNDGTMDTGERVIVAAWKGNNRQVDLFLGTYSEATAGGDPMVDPQDFADGYTLPGTITGLPSPGNPDYAGAWGSADGLSMEWEVPFADTPGQPGLGISPTAAFTFHVSSTNSNPQAGSFPAQIDDNMAGCGGGAGSHQYSGMLFEPDRTLLTGPGATVYAPHRVINLGNGADTFDLVAGAPVGAFSPTVSFYHDVDGGGSFTPGDSLLTDTTGNGEIDTGAFAAGDTLWVLIAYVVPAGATGTVTVISTATSDWDDRFADTVTDILTVASPNLLVTKTSATVSDPINNGTNPKAIPLALVDYLITVTNAGDGTAAGDSVVIADALPPGVELYLGDLDPGGGPADFDEGTPPSGLTYTFLALGDGTDGLDFSIDNGSTWSYVPNPVGGFDPLITDVRVRLAGPLNASGGSGDPSFTLRFRVRVR